MFEQWFDGILLKIPEAQARNGATTKADRGEQRNGRLREGWITIAEVQVDRGCMRPEQLDDKIRIFNITKAQRKPTKLGANGLGKVMYESNRDFIGNPLERGHIEVGYSLGVIAERDEVREHKFPRCSLRRGTVSEHK